MDINFVIIGLFFTSAPSRPSVFHPPPLPTPASSLTHTRSEVEFFGRNLTYLSFYIYHSIIYHLYICTMLYKINKKKSQRHRPKMTFNNSISGSQRGADICVHFSPLLNLEPVFTLTNPLLAVTSQKAGSRHKRVNIIGQVKKSFLLSDVYVCVFSHIFSWIRSVLLDDHAIYSTVGNLSVFLTFLCRLCVRFLIYVMIVLFSVRSVLCPVYMYCVCIDIACPHFFVHVRLRPFGSMIRSNFGSSVLCPVQR